MLKRGNKSFLGIVFTGVLQLLIGCSSNSTSSGPSVVIGTPGREVTIGNDMHEKIVADGATYDDPALQEYIDRIGRQLVANSDTPNSNFTFTVIDSPDINAFALPGGFIYINRGLLAYLEDEAELAGVIGHEIAHVTARHHARQKTASITSTVLATTAYILTGSGDIADASQMYGAELISGYGREMELEADSLGAAYMHKTGYDTQALIDVIGVLKNQETFQRIKAKSGGKKVNTYHGLYATHPRNDQRLKQVITTAGELDQKEYIENPALPGEFRKRMTNLVWGESIQGERAENHFYHNNLAFVIEHPPNWVVNIGASNIFVRNPVNGDELKISLGRLSSGESAQSILESNAQGQLSADAPLDQAGLKGYSAIASDESTAHRIAVINYNKLSYFFEGKSANFSAADEIFQRTIESFRPMHPRERRALVARRIHYIQVPRGATLASLASSMKIPDAESQLRLMNGFYPRGEPRTGDWIKIVR